MATGLREVVQHLRDAGKRVVAWLPGGATTREYFVAPFIPWRLGH